MLATRMALKEVPHTWGEEQLLSYLKQQVADDVKKSAEKVDSAKKVTQKSEESVVSKVGHSVLNALRLAGAVVGADVATTNDTASDVDAAMGVSPPQLLDCPEFTEENLANWARRHYKHVLIR